MAKKVTRTTTQYDMALQRRDGKVVAVIEAETSNVLEDGRGYAGQAVADRQVLIVPLSSLHNLTNAIVRTLTYNTTADAEERYDLDNDHEAHIGLYSPANPHKPVNTFHTVAEGRIALQHAPSGFVLAHLPAEGDEGFRNVIETKP
jgi:hypothetical protein